MLYFDNICLCKKEKQEGTQPSYIKLMSETFSLLYLTFISCSFKEVAKYARKWPKCQGKKSYLTFIDFFLEILEYSSVRFAFFWRIAVNKRNVNLMKRKAWRMFCSFTKNVILTFYFMTLKVKT